MNERQLVLTLEIKFSWFLLHVGGCIAQHTTSAQIAGSACSARAPRCWQSAALAADVVQQHGEAQWPETKHNSEMWNIVVALVDYTLQWLSERNWACRTWQGRAGRAVDDHASQTASTVALPVRQPALDIPGI